jgi:hypothetical protein
VHLLGREHRSFALADAVAGSTHGRGWVRGQDATGDHVVEEHADGGEVLFDRGLGHAVGQQLLYISSDQDRSDALEGAAALLAPGQEGYDGVYVGAAGATRLRSQIQ